MGRGRIIPSRKKREKTTRYDRKKGRCWKPTLCYHRVPLKKRVAPRLPGNPQASSKICHDWENSLDQVSKGVWVLISGRPSLRLTAQASLCSYFFCRAIARIIPKMYGSRRRGSGVLMGIFPFCNVVVWRPAFESLPEGSLIFYAK